jgi:hypothetical protein
MTCTYAAINRKKLIDLDFKYDRYNFDGFRVFLFVVAVCGLAMMLNNYPCLTIRW